MALRRYRKERVNQWRQNHLVSLGQLVEPIALLSAVKSPIPDTAVFDEKVRPYLKTFAAVDEGMQVLDGAENSDAQQQCTFIIRDEGHAVSAGDFIVWGIKVFKVVGFMKHRGINPFLEIPAAPYGTTTTSGFTLDETLPDRPAQATNQQEAVNPFWND